MEMFEIIKNRQEYGFDASNSQYNRFLSKLPDMLYCVLYVSYFWFYLMIRFNWIKQDYTKGVKQ